MAPALVNDGNIVNVDEDRKLVVDLEGKKTASATLNRSLLRDPPLVVSSKGNFVELDNGQQVFDASGGPAVCCLGHGNER